MVAHSAGGTAATIIANQTQVSGVICFGYPFKHPELAEEPRRTAHLTKLSKPCLIIQGDTDEYGNAEQARSYPLGPKTVVLSVQNNHDFNDLSKNELERVYKAILQFLRDAETRP